MTPEPSRTQHHSFFLTRLSKGFQAGRWGLCLACLMVPSLTHAQVAIQDASHVVTGEDGEWYYLILEGENYIEELNEEEGIGFTRVDDSGAITSFLGQPILGADTTASGKGALFTQTGFSLHIDKVTYQVQFARAGTYYLYMRFTMFENGGNTDHYLNEDSFFLPPDFDADPQTDWPLSDIGGYTEGCCNSGFLTIKEDGELVSHSAGGEEGNAFWEGNFHWNELRTSEFLNPETGGEPNVRHRFVVTEDQVGRPLNFTVSYREGGAAIDLWLFSTNPDLMDEYSQDQLDEILLGTTTEPDITVQDPADVVGTGEDAWSYLILEGESFSSEADENPESGFIRVDDSGSIISFLENPVLGTNTTASGRGALFTVGSHAPHSDKVTYRLQFSTPGTYYLYMRFSMFENGGNIEHYLNEDSFFLPPDFDADPQTDWPLSELGGYTEGCCEGGYLTIRENGTPVSHSAGGEEGTAFWEGRFHWNELATSQFLDPEATGEPGVRHRYVVTEENVGKPLTWTVSYREAGTAIDLWLFSTHPNLMDAYTQEELDQILLGSGSDEAPRIEVGRDGGNIVISWPASATGFVLEGSATLSPASFEAVTAAPVVTGDRNTVTLEPADSGRFLRLRRQ